MKKIYNPKDVESSLYDDWDHQDYFKPSNNPLKDNYCIIMPPPNITGSLHIGHAFQHTIMDILIRYQRMQGKNTLWQVGIDHAGIATQMLVERQIAIEEGKTRLDYDRNAFINKIWQWKTKSSKNITYQMRRLGNSVYWKRERFTMDQGMSNAVKEAFVRLYQEDLIYRGKYLVNWDPKLNTAISDLEVENRKIKSSIWYLRYPLDGNTRTNSGQDYLVIATTRPETMLGDTGIAVNPKDKRYHNLIGKFVVLPLVNRRIPIIADEYADITKDTGCVKITPAHDFNDYKVGKRHALPMINIFTFNGNIRQKAEVFDTNGEVSKIFSSEIPIAFRGLERFAARVAIVKELNRLGLLDEIKPHSLTVPYGDRSGAIIEPMLTNQWYVRAEPLAKVAISAVEQGKIQFIPKQYKNMYFSWMNNIQDWCISRQLWWGHRIPAWYSIDDQVYVGRNEIEVRHQYKLTNDIPLRQDEDVLDTWFSSGLWTFSSLGWPEKNDALRMFHPTNVVVSGFDIIFFWISRMIMLTMHFIKDIDGKPQVPFNTVYMTGLVRDKEGHKMSKFKGNIIDPLDIIDGISLINLLKKRIDNIPQPKLVNRIQKCTEKQFPKGIKPYGTDAFRFTLAALASTGRDINWDMKRLEGYRNFCNKLWNASRFVLMNTQNQDCSFNGDIKMLSLADRWILSKFNLAVKAFRTALDTYHFNLATSILYEFTWNQFCDWYLELIKPLIINGSSIELRSTRYTLVNVLDGLLRLAHPVIPFITEAIWQQLRLITNKLGKTIMLQPFPIYDEKLVDSNVLTDLEWIKQIIIEVRVIRNKMNITPKKPLKVLLRQNSPLVIRRVNENLKFILTAAKLDSLNILKAEDQEPISIMRIIDDAEILFPIEGLVDKNAELKRLNKEEVNIKNKIKIITSKLNNEKFVYYAPETIVSKERKKLEKYQQSILKLIKQKTIINNL